MKPIHIICLALGLIAAAGAYASAGDLRSVAGMQSHNCALIVFTPSLADARLKTQSGVMAKLAVEAASRDLLFIQVDPVEVVGASDKPDALRRRFKVPALAYRTLLIDRSGRIVLSARGPVAGATIIRAIDSTSRVAAARIRARSLVAR